MAQMKLHRLAWCAVATFDVAQTLLNLDVRLLGFLTQKLCDPKGVECYSLTVAYLINWNFVLG